MKKTILLVMLGFSFILQAQAQRSEVYVADGRAIKGYDPVAFIQEHHEKITHLHIKDRKKNDGPNMPTMCRLKVALPRWSLLGSDAWAAR